MKGEKVHVPSVNDHEKRDPRAVRFLLLLFFFAALPLTVSSFIIYLYQEYQIFFETRTVLTLLLFHLVAIFTMAFALTPTTFIAVISGYFFSWPGLLGVMAAYPMAALLGLKMGRAANKRVLGDSFYQHPKVQRLLDQIREDEFAMIIFARLSPILPFAMINIALSALKLNVWKYVAGTMIGMFPRTLLFFFAGMEADEIWRFVREPSFTGLSRLLPTLLILISTTGLLWVMKRTLSRWRSLQLP